MLSMIKTGAADNNRNHDVFRKSWYEMSANRHVKTLGPLQGAVNSDVCIIGAGYTGLSAALTLAERGFSVVVLESGEGIAPSASGKNGGHVQRGLAQSVPWLVNHYGREMARELCLAAFDGIDLIKDRIARYQIDCDLHMGQLSTALTPLHQRELSEELAAWDSIGMAEGMTLLDLAQTQSRVRAPDYISGLEDLRSGHFHPYNYALGIAAAAQSLGVSIYDATSAVDIDGNTVKTANGSVAAKHIIIGGNATVSAMKKQLTKSITVTAHMIATKPLAQPDIEAIMPANVAVSEAKFIMNYFRRSHDNRLLFGGNCNYSGRDLGLEMHELQKRMTKVFPTLENIGIDHCWHGPLDLTASRMPAFGRLGHNVYYAHGFGGHGVALSNLAGHLMALAVAGDANKFDLFARIKHLPFPGGNLGKRALFMLGMFWYQLRDELR